MGEANRQFRASPESAVWVFGDITEELVSRVAPAILDLRARGSIPISVFINSNGGVIKCLDHLYSLLKCKTPGSEGPRIVTVALGNAKSAAANLLALGDYAIAYPKASIHFHGVRFGEVEDVTMETASTLAAHLDRSNRAIAALLARAGTQRLAFHYARSKRGFPIIAQREGFSGTASEIQCFAHFLKEKLSPTGDRIVDKALQRWRNLQLLSETVLQKARSTGKRGLKFESHVLRKVVEYEVRRHGEEEWSLDASGVSQVVSDYFLLRDYDLGRHNRLLDSLARRFGFAFFEKEELDCLAPDHAVPPEAKQRLSLRIEQVVRPFCFFASSIWQSMQEDENPLSPTDAYWLGAIDEVYDSGLPCLREIIDADDGHEQSSAPSLEPETKERNPEPL